MFPEQRGPPPKKKKKYEEKRKTLCEIIENARINEQPSTKEENPRTTQDVILEAMLDVADREIKILEEKSDYKTKRYTVSELNGDYECHEQKVQQRDCTCTLLLAIHIQ